MSLWRSLRSPRVVVLCGVLLVAAVLRMIGIRFGLPHPYCRPDETSIVAVVNGFFIGSWHPHFFAYPTFFMVVVAAVLAVWLLVGKGLGYLDHATVLATLKQDQHVFLAARYVSAASGVWTVWLVYRAARELFDTTTALLAAWFLAVAFLHVRDSHFGVTDVAATAIAVAAFLQIAQYWRTGQSNHLLAGAALTGLAAATKYNLGLIAVTGLIAIWKPGVTPPPVSRRVSQTGVFGLLAALTFVAGAPYTVLDYGAFFEALQSEARHLSLGHGVELGVGWVSHLTRSLHFGMGKPLLTCGVLGLAVLAFTHRAGLLLVSFPLAYYAVLGSGHTVFARYMTPVVPFLCLAAAAVTAHGARLVTDRWHRPLWRERVAIAATVLISVPTTWSSLQFDRLLSKTDTRLMAAQWIERTYPDGASLAQTGPQSGQVIVAARHPDRARRFPTFPLDATGIVADVVIMPASPLFKDNDSARRSDPSLGHEYRLAAEFRSDSGAAGNVYDWQDEFYVPFAGFRGVERPGPNIRVFTRTREQSRATTAPRQP